jgi:hypothetical protein
MLINGITVIKNIFCTRASENLTLTDEVRRMLLNSETILLLGLLTKKYLHSFLAQILGTYSIRGSRNTVNVKHN